MDAGHVFVDSIVLGSIEIITVAADPNGALTAPLGSVAYRTDVGNASIKYRNTDGSMTWAVA